MEQKDYLFKLTVAEKINRIMFLKNISGKMFKAQKYQKAEKIYKRMNHFFKGKDAKNNFCKENEQSVEYRDAIDELDLIAKSNLTNIAVVCLKQ